MKTDRGSENCFPEARGWVVTLPGGTQAPGKYKWKVMMGRPRPEDKRRRHTMMRERRSGGVEGVTDTYRRTRKGRGRKVHTVGKGKGTRHIQCK